MHCAPHFPYTPHGAGRLLLLPVFFLLAALAAPAHGFEPDEYLTVGAYVAEHPEQTELMKAFIHTVRAPARHVALDKRPRVAMVFPGKQRSDYWRRSLVSFEERMDEYGVEYALRDLFLAPDAGVREQEAVIDYALQQDPDYLVFTLDAKRHRHIIERLLLAGRPKVLLQNITTPVRAWEGMQPFLYVGFDHITGSELLADRLVDRTSGTGSYVMLLPKPGYLSTVRGDAFADRVAHRSGLKLAGIYHPGIDQKRAREAALQALDAHPGLSFIYAGTTDIALGAMEAVAERGQRGKVLVNGWGGGGPEIEAIRRGDLDLTVMRINDDNGVAMADAIVLDSLGRGDQVPTIFSGDFALIEKGIPPTTLDALTRRAFRYSD